MKRNALSILIISALLTLYCGESFGKGANQSGNESHSDRYMMKAGSVSSLSGEVVETMDSGGYTYVCIVRNGEKTWLAIPETKISIGEEMSFRPGGEMFNFKSKTLNRTFDRIIFSAGPHGENEDPSGAASMGSKGAVIVSKETIKVERAPGDDGYTVAEVHRRITKLDKKLVSVRGKVIKVSAGIMGKNWIHIQDGTGDPGSGSSNLVVTSQDLPSVGDIVTVQGTLYKDRDFGSGYIYKVIMEEARIKQ